MNFAESVEYLNAILSATMRDSGPPRSCIINIDTDDSVLFELVVNAFIGASCKAKAENAGTTTHREYIL